MSFVIVTKQLPVPVEQEPSDSIFRQDKHPATGSTTRSRNDEFTTEETEAVINCQKYYRNFCWYAILFGANHATGLASLPLATARLGSNVGSKQTAILYLCYTASACLGATLLVRSAGPHHASIVGMTLFCCYVGCFVPALLFLDNVDDVDKDGGGGNSHSSSYVLIGIVYLGAALGGIGAGVAWTAQGVFFAETAVTLSSAVPPIPSSHLASVFACSILLQETILEALSTVLGKFWNWSTLFGLYFGLAVVSTIAMGWCCVTPLSTVMSLSPPASTRSKLLAALVLLRDDPTMKYMIAFNVSFSLAGAFLNSFVSGEVVVAVVRDDSYIGILTAFHGIVAALSSAILGNFWATKKIAILMFGSACFSLIAVPTLLWPDFQNWNPLILVFIYTLEGIGRATFEGTLKALFADLYAHEKEGAFANIILQYGLASSFAYVLSDQVSCMSLRSVFCAQYRDGSHHDLLIMSLIVLVFGLLSILSLRFVLCSGTARSTRLQGQQWRFSIEMLSNRFMNGTYETLERNDIGLFSV